MDNFDPYKVFISEMMHLQRCTWLTNASSGGHFLRNATHRGKCVRRLTRGAAGSDWSVERRRASEGVTGAARGNEAECGACGNWTSPAACAESPTRATWRRSAEADLAEGRRNTQSHTRTVSKVINICEVCVWLTDKALNAEGLDLHVDQQSAVRLHQGRGQGKTRLGVGQFNDTGCNAVDQANGENVKSNLRMWYSWMSTTTIHYTYTCIHSWYTTLPWFAENTFMQTGLAALE